MSRPSVRATIEQLERRRLLTGDPYHWAHHAWENIDLVPGVATTLLDGPLSGTASIPLGANTLNFYGTSYTGSNQLFVGKYGLITFVIATGSSENTDLAGDPTYASIAPLWDFWQTGAVDASAGADNDVILYDLDAANNRLVIEWSNVSFPGTNDRVTFQAILQLNTGATPGEIVFNYTDLEANPTNANFGRGATVGIKAAGAQGPDRLLVSMNSGALLGNQTALRLFTAPPAGTGSISGIAFHDHDADGVRDAGENGLDGALVYVDANDDGFWNAGETNVATSNGGRYTISGLPVGSYRLRQIAPATFTGGGAGPLVVIDSAGAAVSGIEFGNTATHYSGTFGHDDYRVRKDATGTKLEILIDDVLTYTTYGLPQRVTFDLGQGDNRLTVDYVNGNVTTATRVDYTAIESPFTTNQLDIIGSTSADGFSFHNNVASSGTNVSTSGVDVINIVGGGGNDVLFVGSDIARSFTFDGGPGTDRITIQGTAGGDNIVLTAESITGAAASIGYVGAAPENVQVNGMAGNDVITITGNPAGTTLGVSTGDNADTINIGGTTFGQRMTDAVDGTITLLGDATDAIHYNDQDNTVAGTTYTLTAGTIARPGAATLQFAGGPSFAINMPNTASHIDVTGSQGRLFINMNNGPQTATIGPDLGAFAGPIDVYDFGTSSDSDGLVLQDTAPFTGQTYTLGFNQITRGSLALTYGNLENLTIEGTAGNDTFNVVNVGFNTDLALRGNGGTDSFVVSALSGDISVDGGSLTTFDELTVNGFAQFTQTLTSTAVSDASRTINYTRLRRLILNLNSGDDTLNINSTAFALPTTINGGDGNDVVNVATTPSAIIRFQGGLDQADTDTLNVNGGTFTFSGQDYAAHTANLQVNVNNAGSAVVFGTNQSLAGLTLGAGTTGTMPAAGFRYLHTRGLGIAATAKLDLTDNDLIWDYTGDSTYSAVRQYVLNGRDNPGGAGGIVSTFLGDTILAPVDNAGFGRTEWRGRAIDLSTVIGKYTYYGDTNLDGSVTGDDYLALDSNLGISPGTRQWLHGDFNFDGAVTGDDYLAIDTNLGKGTPIPLAWADEQEAMIALHAERFGGNDYVKAVEAAMKTTSKTGRKKLMAGR